LLKNIHYHPREILQASLYRKSQKVAELLDSLNKNLTDVDVESPCNGERESYCGAYDSDNAVGEEHAEWEKLLSREKNGEKLTRFEK
jgi:hypothetical protein